jgi:hypothetical protein
MARHPRAQRFHRSKPRPRFVESRDTGGRQIVVAPRGTLFAACDAIALPSRPHKALLLDSPQNRIHGTAGQVGRIHDVEPVMTTRSKSLENQGGLVGHDVTDSTYVESPRQGLRGRREEPGSPRLVELGYGRPIDCEKVVTRPDTRAFRYRAALDRGHDINHSHEEPATARALLEVAQHHPASVPAVRALDLRDDSAEQPDHASRDRQDRDGRQCLHRPHTGILAKLRLKPGILAGRGSASPARCLLCLAPLGGHLPRAVETCFIRHDVGLGDVQAAAVPHDTGCGW